MNLDKKFKETDYIKRNSYGKLISILKRQFDQWVTEQLAERHHFDFKIAHMPLIMNIALEGTNNNELAKKARVTKQAMSKVVKELLDLGYIQVKPDSNDKRVTTVTLTDRGKKFVIEARMCIKELHEEYRKAVGKARYDGMIETMILLEEYNNSKAKANA